MTNGERHEPQHALPADTDDPVHTSTADTPGTIELPAQPAVDAFRLLVNHPHFGAGDERECARGLGVDHDWLASLLSGDRATLDARDLSRVCEALQCTPYTLWPADVARETLDRYPPERWPSRTAPLDDLLTTSDDMFITRRVEQQAAEILSLSVIPQRLEPTNVTVTPFHIDGLVAVHEHTGMVVTEPRREDLASANYDYFFAFTQRGPDELAVAYLPDGALRDAPPPGATAPPDLVRIANDLATRLPGTDAIEVRDTSGANHWIGRAPDSSEWESWSHPASRFPGDADFVIRRSDHLSLATNDALRTPWEQGVPAPLSLVADFE